MTGRKPPDVRWESWIERQIREGAERGEFDNLPGSGKPLADLDAPHDDDRWIKAKLRHEEASYLPATLQIRKDREDALAAIAAATTEQEVRRIAAEVNEKIRAVNRLASSGPPSSVTTLEVEAVVARWREGRT